MKKTNLFLQKMESKTVSQSSLSYFIQSDFSVFFEMRTFGLNQGVCAARGRRGRNIERKIASALVKRAPAAMVFEFQCVAHSPRTSSKAVELDLQRFARVGVTLFGVQR